MKANINKGRKSYVLLLLLAVFGVGVTCQINAAGLLIADGGFGGRLTIEEQDVKVTINNGVAVTEVIQVFKNQENRQVEALYTFPVPRGASVSNFSMWINEKEMIGEVLEKKRARQIYESYKKTRRDPGLLEQKDYKTFEMRIFPINPKAKQKVKICYYQELDVDHDWATYVYPLATATRNVVSNRTEGKFALNLNVKSEVAITKLESPSHGKEFVVAKHSDKYYQASMETKDGDLNKDVVLAFHLQRPQSGFDVITSKQSDEDGYFAMTMTVGKELEKMNKGMDFIFVLDISGSMNTDGKMRLSRNSLNAFIDELGELDNFELIAFNVSPSTLFNNLTKVSKESKAKAAEFLRQQEARGGTNLRPAINTAYKYSNPDRQLNIVVLSDGMTEQQSELVGLIRSRPGNARIFCIGVGNEVNRPLLKQVAEGAGGMASFISRGDNFSRQAKAFRRKLMRPAISNIKLDFASNIYDIEPKVIPNIYHGMPVRIYGRYKGSGNVDVAVSGDIGSKEFSQKTVISLPAEDEKNPEIDRMWAWHKTQRLLKEVDRGNDRNRLIDEIVRLGEGYSIVTKYTSFLVLENDAEYKRWKINRRNALRVKRDRKSRQLVQAQLQKLRTAATNNIGPNSVAVAPKPVQQVASVPPSVATRAPRTQSSPSRRSTSFDLPRVGGGAVDPFTVIMSLLFGAGLLAFWKRNSNN